MTAELHALRQQQRDELVATIALEIGPGVVFSARQAWQHRLVSPALAAVYADAGIRGPRSLGRQLRTLCGAPVGREHGGRLWVVSLSID